MARAPGDAAADDPDLVARTQTCPEAGTTTVPPLERLASAESAKAKATPSEAARAPAAKRGASDVRVVADITRLRASRRLEAQAAEAQAASAISAGASHTDDEDEDGLPQ
eukprot:TRINITY_DN5435_c0_g1_i3.p2 TRINITY_DN5435_c0_g1~~TRINITY_DN5435_c0_g1_i3.p2  ORF type:complete len:110 (-),score=29.55 TRINITY_DN5435_c0_g1_i3:421-750(-)